MAKSHSRKLAEELSDYNYTNVHLVGHSAGSQLIDNEWEQITLPANQSSGISVSALSTSLPAADYGVSWFMYKFDVPSQDYIALAANDIMQPGVGYWFIQITGNTVILSVPDSAVTKLTVSDSLCTTSTCFSYPLTVHQPDVTWHLAGYPFTQSQLLGNTTIKASQGTCANGCEYQEAEAENLMLGSLFH